MTAAAASAGAEERELEALLDVVRAATGIDFGGYARSTVRRRLEDVAVRRGVKGFAGLRAEAARPDAMAEVLEALCVSVTAMFRDAGFFRAFRAVAVPRLARHGPVRAWHAGCATGEELWSHAIVLHEAGLGRHARLYGTDISPAALAVADGGVLPLDRMREYTAAYHHGGGLGDFSAYYVADAQRAVIRAGLRRGARFGRHDVTEDPPFGTFDVVFCRNVLIYLAPALQARVLERLGRSLRPGGVLALGRAETLAPSLAGQYEELDGAHRLFVRR